MPQNDIKLFIDFFFDATQKIRKTKAIFIRGKDGTLVERDLKIFSRSQLEMLTVWFLAKKPKLAATIGAMLSNKFIEELKKQLSQSEFWRDLDELYEIYYKKQNTVTKIDLDILKETLINKYKNI